MSNRGGRGRGAYYKAKYGSQRQEPSAGSSVRFTASIASSRSTTHDWDQLQQDLRSIDGKQYGAYKRLIGKYYHELFLLSIDHVQGDAYAAPSRVRAVMPLEQTGIPPELLDTDIKRIALCDYVTRVAASIIRHKALDQNAEDTGWSGVKGGAFNINAPGQQVLPRSSAVVDDETIELRFSVSLPAAGRTVLGHGAHQILAVNLLDLVEQCLLYTNLDPERLRLHVQTTVNQHALRQQLSAHGLIAFIANGSILPRASGASAKVMQVDAVPFRSPNDLELSMRLADGTVVLGMGLPSGVTVLTGGGFHGKSTVLEAIELGVYDHVRGDGRELVVTNPIAVKIRAEDGRSITGTNISALLSQLPGGKSTEWFTTEDASGSTSMAANISEVLEVGSKLLLIDEDSSATNLLVRDQRMQSLIKNEPITPLVSKVRALYQQHGVSTIMVVGGLGDWLAVADHVIAMDSYTPHLVTGEARDILQQYPTEVTQQPEYGVLSARQVQVQFDGEIDAHHATKSIIPIRPAVRDPMHNSPLPAEGIDLSSIDQIIEAGQSKLAANTLQRFAQATAVQSFTIEALVTQYEADVRLDKCMPAAIQDGQFVAARRFELAAALSRLRGLRMT